MPSLGSADAKVPPARDRTPDSDSSPTQVGAWHLAPQRGRLRPRTHKRALPINQQAKKEGGHWPPSNLCAGDYWVPTRSS